jgi:hypothetical protein
MKYPSCVLSGEGARGEVLSMPMPQVINIKMPEQK